MIAMWSRSSSSAACLPYRNPASPTPPMGLTMHRPLNPRQAARDNPCLNPRDGLKPHRGGGRSLALLLVSGLLWACSSAPVINEGQNEPVAWEQSVRIPSDEGVELAAWRYGPPQSAELLVVVGDGPGLDHQHLQDLSQLASSELRVLLFDPRGTGQSTGSQAPQSIADFARDIEALRQHQRAPQMHLLAYGWGGLVAIDYAASFPEQVSSLTLVSPAPLSPAARVSWSSHKPKTPSTCPEPKAPSDLQVAEGYGADLFNAATMVASPTLVIQGAADPRPIPDDIEAGLSGVLVEPALLAGAGPCPWKPAFRPFAIAFASFVSDCIAGLPSD